MKTFKNMNEFEAYCEKEIEWEKSHGVGATLEINRPWDDEPYYDLRWHLEGAGYITKPERVEVLK